MGKILSEFAQENSQKTSVSSQSSSCIVHEYNIPINMSKSTGNLRTWFHQKFGGPRQSRITLKSKTVAIRSTSAPNLGPKAIRQLMNQTLPNGDCEIFCI